jgi:hypothetical protein
MFTDGISAMVVVEGMGEMMTYMGLFPMPNNMLATQANLRFSQASWGSSARTSSILRTRMSMSMVRPTI